MKIIAENPAEEALLWRIKALSDELVNQDNRSPLVCQCGRS